MDVHDLRNAVVHTTDRIGSARAFPDDLDADGIRAADRWPAFAEWERLLEDLERVGECSCSRWARCHRPASAQAREGPALVLRPLDGLDIPRSEGADGRADHEAGASGLTVARCPGRD